MTLSVSDSPRPLTTHLLGLVENPELGPEPYRIDRDGRPFVPAGDGGVVLGAHVGDCVWAFDGEHVAPGATLAHPDGAARYALVAQACLGNAVEVLSGLARGERGRVVGKRGEAGRVLIALPDAALARLLAGDRVRVEARGLGGHLDGRTGTHVMNVDPDLLGCMPFEAGADGVRARVRAVLPARLCGNGVGRPAAMWDVDLQVDASEAGRWGLGGLRIGDLVALADWDARFQHGYRRGATTVAVVVHGPSRVPGHGPGVVAVLTAPDGRLRAEPDDDPDDNLAAWLAAMTQGAP